MNLNRRHVGAWALFDFANSVYPAVITATVFGVYYATGIVGNETGLGDRGIDHPVGPELGKEPVGQLEGPPIGSDIFPHEEDPVVLLHGSPETSSQRF